MLASREVRLSVQGYTDSPVSMEKKMNLVFKKADISVTLVIVNNQ
jgi:hypothetical protein